MRENVNERFFIKWSHTKNMEKREFNIPQDVIKHYQTTTKDHIVNQYMHSHIVYEIL